MFIRGHLYLWKVKCPGPYIFSPTVKSVLNFLPSVVYRLWLNKSASRWVRQDIALILRASITQSDLNSISNRKYQIGVSLYTMSSARPEKVSLGLTMTDENTLLSPLRSCGLLIFQLSPRGGVWTEGPTWVSTTVVIFSEILGKTFLTIWNFKDMFSLFPLVLDTCLNNYPIVQTMSSFVFLVLCLAQIHGTHWCSWAIPQFLTGFPQLSKYWGSLFIIIVNLHGLEAWQTILPNVSHSASCSKSLLYNKNI